MAAQNLFDSDFVEVDGIKLHYRSLGNDNEEVVVLLHGWPTSSYLWRNVMPAIATRYRVIALDLPGFGLSEKPLNKSYSFRFYGRIIDGFLNALNIDHLSLVVHDMGGPVGLRWAVDNFHKLDRMVLLNTLVYPEMSWAVKLFMMMTFLPGIKHWLASPAGIKFSIKFGVVNKNRVTPQVLYPYQQPFKKDKQAQTALLKSVQRLSPEGFTEISQKLPTFNGPVRLIYGKDDRILPDVSKTMARLKQDLPQATLTELPECGHFLQEDAGEKVGRLIAQFLDESSGKDPAVAMQ